MVLYLFIKKFAIPNNTILFFVGYIDLLSDAKVQRAILAFVGEMDGAKLNKFNSLLDSHNKNAMFYMAHTKSSNSLEHGQGNYHMIWDQVNIY